MQTGASIINDVSGLQFDPAMAEITAQTGATLILMHSQGTPDTMQNNPSYPKGVVEEVIQFFRQQTSFAIQAGVSKERIIIDPGFGFGKTLAHNLLLLKELPRLHALGYPILVGTSRKSFLTQGHNIPSSERETLTAVSLALAIQNGASYVRIHDVASQAPAIRLIDATLNAV
jgi:dihydropteroate synthase